METNDPSFLVDSMYEMDAPHCADFNATDLSVNESIFEKRTVGEKNNLDKELHLASQLDFLSFQSPSDVFKDIGNVTPNRVLRSATKQRNTPKVKTLRTPVRPSPLALEEKKITPTPTRVTRSMTLVKSPFLNIHMDEAPYEPTTPKQKRKSRRKSSTPVADLIEPECSVSNDGKLDDLASTEQEDNNLVADTDTPDPYPEPVHYETVQRRKSLPRPDVDGSQVCSKPVLRATRASTGNLQNPAVNNMKKTRHSAGSAQMSSADAKKSSSSVKSQPKSSVKYSGTPYKEKQIRLRTRSQDSKPTQPKPRGTTSLRTRTSSASATRSSNDTSDQNHNTRKRTSSTTSSAASSAGKPLRVRASSSSALDQPATETGKKLSFRSSSVSTTSSISPALSRLMRPTASALQKVHHREDSVSPNKRKNLDKDEHKPPKVPRNTIPKTPNCMKHRSRMTPVKSSEDLQLEAVKNEKAAMDSLKKKNSESLKGIIAGSGRKLRDKPSDLPTGKSHSMNTRSANNQVQTKRSLYDRFNARRETETMEKSNMPERYPSGKRVGSPVRSIYKKASTTVPQSPKFHTTFRSRTPSVPTAEEREAKELEAMKEQQFKARPLDMKIFEGPSGIKQKDRLPITEPIQVKFATDERIAKHQANNKADENEEPEIKAKPAPKFTSVFQPKLDHKATRVQPFSFEGKDEEAKRRIEDLRKKLDEEERKLREFKANPLPTAAASLPERKVQQVTVPEPFHLRIDERGELQQEKLKRKLEEEQTRLLESSVYHARPADVLKKQPFVPKKLEHKPIVPLQIELASERRAEERLEYETRKKEMEEQNRAIEEQIRLKKEEQDRLEMIRLRQETVIKPAPIKTYKPIEIKPSSKPLTTPVSPSFCRK